MAFKLFRVALGRTLLCGLIGSVLVIPPAVATEDYIASGSIALLRDACPQPWENVDQKITGSGVVPWASTADRERFNEFQRNVEVTSTRLGSHSEDFISADLITVLSECVKRQSVVVDEEFNNSIKIVVVDEEFNNSIKIPDPTALPDFNTILQSIIPLL